MSSYNTVITAREVTSSSYINKNFFRTAFGASVIIFDGKNIILN